MYLYKVVFHSFNTLHSLVVCDYSYILGTKLGNIHNGGWSAAFILELKIDNSEIKLYGKEGYETALYCPSAVPL